MENFGAEYWWNVIKSRRPGVKGIIHNSCVIISIESSSRYNNWRLNFGHDPSYCRIVTKKSMSELNLIDTEMTAFFNSIEEAVCDILAFEA